MSQTLFKIDKNVPLPDKLLCQTRKRQSGDKLTQTIDALKIGQSFYIEDATNVSLSGRLTQARGRNFAHYAYRKEGNGARVWRVPMPIAILHRGAS